jgi:REP element-mobilizing transposase RayT
LEEIPNHFENIILDEFVIMPNHVHGIIGIIEPSVGDAYMRPLPKRNKMILSTIVQQYKASVSREIKEINNEFGWQRSFYDRTIRNEREFHNIQAYIYYNPVKWQWDIENKAALKPDKNYYEKLFA